MDYRCQILRICLKEWFRNAISNLSSTSFMLLLLCKDLLLWYKILGKPLLHDSFKKEMDFLFSKPLNCLLPLCNVIIFILRIQPTSSVLSCSRWVWPFAPIHATCKIVAYSEWWTIWTVTNGLLIDSSSFKVFAEKCYHIHNSKGTSCLYVTNQVGIDCNARPSV